MTITAQQVKELRDRTGAGMMECKKALVETSGDLEAAIDHLRKAGLAKAGKKAGRVAAEGVIALARNASEAVLVEINSETDFVARDASFLEFAGQTADAALHTHAGDAAELTAAALPGGETVETARQALIARIGENVQVRRLARLTGGGALGAYIHGGRIGVLVTVQGGDQELADDLAMHIAAFAPQWIDHSAVPPEVIAKEKEILLAQAEGSGKPPEIVAKMVEGRLAKQLDETTLAGQPFVKDNDTKVGKLLAARGAKVLDFVRLVVGEGIEKETSDFAAEVMSQVRRDGE